MVGHAGVLSAPAGAGARPAWLGAGAALLLLAALAMTDPVCALWAKAVVDPFFHSTSSGAAVGLLVFVALCCGRMGLAAPGAAVSRVAPAALLAAVLVGNVTNLIAHAWLLQRFELPITAAVYHWSEGQNTYSWLFHSHSGKVALDLLFAGVLGHWAPSYDFGQALGSALPLPFSLLCAGSLLLGIVSALVLLPAAARRWGPAGALLFGFCALSCAKTIVDGGPLTYRFVPAAAVLVVLLGSLAGWPGRVRLSLAWGGVLAVAAYLGLWAVLSPEPGVSALTGMGFTLAVMAGLGLWVQQPRSPSGRAMRPMLVFVCASMGVVGVAASLLGTAATLLMPLDADMRAVVCRADACVRQEAGGRSAFEVYRLAGDDPLKPRHTFIAPESSFGPTVRLAAVVRPLRSQPPAARPAVPVRALPVEQVPGAGNVLVELTAAGLPQIFGGAPHPFGNRNYHVFLHRAAATLHSQGLQSFVLSPLRDAADLHALGLD